MCTETPIIPSDAKEYEKLAKLQLKFSILKKSSTEFNLALTAAEWQSAAAAWFLIRRGVYVPKLKRSILKQLRSPAVRDEAEAWARRRNFTIEDAAAVMGCEDSLEAFEKFEDTKPILLPA